MSYSHRLLILTLTPIFLLACQTGMSDEAKQKIDSLAVAVDSLRERTDSLSTVVDRQKDHVRDVLPKWAELNPATEGFALASTKFGPFAFEVREISPRANGSVLTLAVGNLTGAIISEKEFDIYYESTNEDAEIEIASFTLQDRLVVGHWRRKEVQLPGVRPENLGEVDVVSNNYDSPRLLYNFE